MATMIHWPSARSARDMGVSSLKGACYAVLYVLFKIAVGLGYPLGKLYIIVLASVIGAIAGSILYLTRNFSRRSGREYYASWGITGAVVGGFIAVMPTDPYPDAGTDLKTRLLIIGMYIPIGMLVGVYAKYVQARLRKNEHSD